MIKLESKSIEDLSQIVQKILVVAEKIKVWIFEGEMGVGKTTLIKEICRQFGVVDAVQSPTYSIVNEYLTVKGQTLYHFDFYRIEEETEAMDIGCEEYFASGCYCFIEWPSKIENLIPFPYLKLDLKAQEDGIRHINLTKHYG